ncbi:VWA domain-containing protein [Streptomyces sp. NPDC005805]|uniref:vWA domain-containing protein n=1 Tax=Streptomyces sp. NPDC005805 TaxID=3157068 RepID=UPI00340587C7
MPAFAESERPAIFPVCLLVDVSGSMSGRPMAAMNQALPAMRQAVLDDPTTGEIARIAMVTFSDTGSCVLPLCDMAHAEMPTLSPQGGTNFAEGFRAARAALVDGISGLGRGTRYHRPVVFFLSDGQHNGPGWQADFDRLRSREDKFGAEVVSFGFGQANREVIAQVSTAHAFYADDMEPAVAVKEILHTVLMSIKTTSGSFQAGGAAGLSVPASTGLTPLPVLSA